MTDSDLRDKQRRADEQRQRRIALRHKHTNETDLAGAVWELAGTTLASAGVKMLTTHTGLGSAIERGLTFSSRFLLRSAAFASSKAIEDWTIKDARRLARGAKEAFRSAKADFRKIEVKAHDQRTLFGTLSTMMSLADSSGRALKNEIWRNEQIIDPALKRFRKSRMRARVNDNEGLRMEEFIRRVAARPQDIVGIHKLKKELFGSKLNNPKLHKSADVLTRYIQRMTEANSRKVSDRRVKAGFLKIIDEASNIDNLERNFGTIRTKKENFLGKINQFLNGEDRGLTVREILEDKSGNIVGEKYETVRGKNKKQHDIIEDLRDFAEYGKKKYGNEWYERFMDITPDARGMRKDFAGNAYSREGRNRFMDDLTSELAGTLPGKIAKLRDVNLASKAPQFAMWARGSIDPVLAALTNKDKNSHEVDSTLFRIYDNYYRMEKSGALTNLGNLGGTHLYSGRFGATQHLMHQIAGDVRYKESSNSLLRTLDLFQDRDEFSGRSVKDYYHSLVDKFSSPEYIGNVIDDLINPHSDSTDRLVSGFLSGDKQAAVEYLAEARQMREFLDERTYELSKDAASTLAKRAEGDAKKILEALSSDDTSAIEQALMDLPEDELANVTLSDMAYRLRTKRSSVEGTIKQNVSRSRSRIGSSIADIFGTGFDNETATYAENIRKEMSKEALLKIARGEDGEFDYQKTLDIINDASEEMSIRDATEARRLAHFTTLEKRGDFDHAGSEDETFRDIDLFAQAFSAHDAIAGKDAVSEDFRNVLKDIKSEQLNWQTTFYSDADEIGNPGRYNNWATIRDNTGVVDILRSMNDWAKFKATAKQFGQQFVAGRDNLENVSEATLAPYFMFSRLSDELNTVGLGFSRDSMGSTWDMVKAIAMKRALPLWVGATYAEWMDDTSEEVTGMSISGAAAQGIADVDLAARKTMDAVGLTDWLKGEKALNPIMQYWGDHNDFMSYDERREWYANGYDPVRKGAWWTFGGVNEARGSEIEYWQPSFARRIQSGYKDKSLYEGYSDKWSHSLLPTPSNPLSPLMAVLDPNWLEDRHKDDRPYELSGEMFENGTPWGAILNPTIGAVIKPQESRNTFLGFDYRNINGIDPKALIHAINMEIRQKARDIGHQNFIEVKNDQYKNVDVNMLDAPTEDTRTASIQFHDGQIVRANDGTYGVYSPYASLDGSSGAVLGGGSFALQQLKSIDEDNHIGWKEAIDYSLFGGPPPMQAHAVVSNKKGQAVYVDTSGAPVDGHARSLFTEDRIAIDKQINGDIDGIKGDLEQIISRFNPKKAMNYINAATKEKGKAGKFNAYDFDGEEAIATAEKLKSYRPTDSLELLNNADAVTDLINSNKGSDGVRDAAISWRLVSGIYGYALGEETGFGVDNQKRIATAQDMSSFSRTFWDDNLGGLGGSAMEILRRFVPDYRRGTRVSPLMNEMPDWLPERFKYGDPFTSVPKGEARLPGKGYESLNALHPDQYGDYGAFDRFKILADIAPSSPEYKLWRDIAKKTVTDPELVEEMQDIRDRVNQQGKKHDFYDYRVVGKGLEYKNVVVSEILDYGKFRSGNTIFKVAGASVRGNAEETMKDVLGRYIHVGEKITVAVDENEADRRNNDSIGSINAAVFAGGENVGLQMIEQGDATVRKGDTSSAALLAQYGPMQKMIGYASEVFAHLDVPWLSDQFLRVRSPLEAYKAEEVYGTPYQTWSRPIDSFLMPAIERAMHDRTAFTGLIGTAARYIADKPGLTPGQNHFIKASWLLSDRGAFIGAAVSNFVKPGDGAQAMKWARHGSAIVSLGHVLTGGNGYFDEVFSAANIGQEVARFLGKNRTVGAAIGAAAGIAYRAGFGDNGEWIPDRIKKKWELEDYFDRLTYIKYMGLYHQAAEKAKEEEGVDMEDVFERRQEAAEQNRLAIGFFKSLKKQMARNAPDSDVRSDLMSELNRRIEALDNDKMVVPGGEWTRTAILYKQAADATVYALKDSSSWSQMISALPTNDREFFMEFVKVRDNSQREEILRVASPFLKKALALAWGQKPPEEETNEEFFEKHELPRSDWAGWAPQYDLKDIQVKTIENEGMMLSDFGYYDSQLRDPAVQDAPTTNFSGTTKHHNIAAVKKNLEAALKGAGLEDVDITVTPGPTGGFTAIKAAIKQMMGFRDAQKQVEESLSMQASI